MFQRLRVLGFWAVVLSAALAACGDDDEETADTGAADTGADGVADTVEEPTGDVVDGGDADAEPVGVTFSGTIVALIGGEGIEGVDLCIFEDDEFPCAVTDENGEFEITDLPEDTEILIEASKDGYYPALYPMDTTAGDLVGFQSALPTDLEAELNAALAGYEDIESNGAVLVVANSGWYPELGEAAWGVSVEIDAESATGPVYLDIDGLPDADATSTSSASFIGIGDLAAGEYAITASSDVRQCSAAPNVWQGDEADTVRVPVEPGHITGSAFVCPHGEADWDCVGSVEWPSPTEATVPFIGRVADFTTQQPVAGITVKACARDDVACDSPIATATTDEEGLAEVDLPTGDDGFDGYFEVSGEGRWTTLQFFPRPYTEPYPFIPISYSVTDSTIALLETLGLEYLDGYGHAAVVAADCDGFGVAGVEVGVDAENDDTIVFYTRDGAPRLDAVGTDETGAVGFVNLTAGPAVFVADRQDADAPHGTIELFTRADTITLLNIGPTP